MQEVAQMLAHREALWGPGVAAEAEEAVMEVTVVSPWTTLKGRRPPL